MIVEFTYTKYMLDLVFEFIKLYERLYMLPKGNIWIKKIIDYYFIKTPVSAVLVDRMKLQGLDFLNESEILNNHLTLEEKKSVLSYKNVLKSIQNYTQKDHLSEELIHELHSSIMDNKVYPYRKESRFLEKFIIENNVKKTIKVKVISSPEKISFNLNLFFKYLGSLKNDLNPLILTSLVHLNIALIHPFSDGNGRLVRATDNFLLKKNGFDFFHLISLEEYYLNNIEKYYSLIETTSLQKDATRWIEFFLQGLLSSVNETANLLNKFSCGSLDVLNNKFIDLDFREQQVLDQINKNIGISGADIGRNIGITRQAVSLIVKDLRRMGFIEKYGYYSGTRYLTNSIGN